MKPVFADFGFLKGVGIVSVKHGLVIDADDSLIRSFQEVQTAQKGGFSASGRADNGKNLAFFKLEADVLQDLRLIE